MPPPGVEQVLGYRFLLEERHRTFYRATPLLGCRLQRHAVRHDRSTTGNDLDLRSTQIHPKAEPNFFAFSDEDHALRKFGPCRLGNSVRTLGQRFWMQFSPGVTFLISELSVIH